MGRKKRKGDYMKKKITRIDDWMKANGLIDDFEKAAIRKGNFCPENWEDDFEAMRAKVTASISRKEKHKELLQDQLLGGFVFRLTPQGEDFWWNIFRRLVCYESQNKVAE